MRYAKALAALITVCLLDAGHSVSYARKVRTQIELGVIVHRDLAQLKIAILDPSRARPGRRPVTDLMLTLSARGSDIDAVLRLPNGRRPRDGRSLMRARVFAVVGGHIYSDALAWCSGWQHDVSHCQVDCDAGQFSLRRYSGGIDGTRLDLIVGGDSDATLDTERGFLVNACQYEGGPELRLVPAPGERVTPLALKDQSGVD